MEGISRAARTSSARLKDESEGGKPIAGPGGHYWSQGENHATRSGGPKNGPSASFPLPAGCPHL